MDADATRIRELLFRSKARVVRRYRKGIDASRSHPIGIQVTVLVSVGQIASAPSVHRGPQTRTRSIWKQYHDFEVAVDLRHVLQMQLDNGGVLTYGQLVEPDRAVDLTEVYESFHELRNVPFRGKLELYWLFWCSSGVPEVVFCPVEIADSV